jgi:hypothetical protein
MELMFILIPILGFVLLKMVFEHRAQARADNVRLLEEALKSPHLDRPTIESLTYQLTGHRVRPGGGHGRLMALVLALGWLALFTGIGLWIAGEFSHDRDMFAGGIITAVVGFGLVTYPFALRELEARRQPQ